MEQAHISHASMAMGCVSINNSPCEIFEGLESTLCDAFVPLTAVTAGCSGGVSAEHLSKIFCIPHDDAARTLLATSQLVQHNANLSLSRNVTTDDCALCYCKIKSYFFTDFATAKAKITCGNICGQVFTSDKGFVVYYPMKDQCSYFAALKVFAKEVGTPEVLVCNSHLTQKKLKVKEFCIKNGTTLCVLEAETQWANCAKLYVGLLKEAIQIADNARVDECSVSTSIFCRLYVASVGGGKHFIIWRLFGPAFVTLPLSTSAHISSTLCVQNLIITFFVCLLLPLPNFPSSASLGDNMVVLDIQYFVVTLLFGPQKATIRAIFG